VTGICLHLESATRSERIDDVVSFVAEDASGSFGIQQGHERMVTVLEFGLARFRVAGGDWQYVAAPGAVLYCCADELHFSTRRYVLGDDFETIGSVLEEELRVEERELELVKISLRGLEEEMMKRLWRLGRSGETFS
jgi:F-type H+-transporting ATPase subunit epsilon